MEMYICSVLYLLDSIYRKIRKSCLYNIIITYKIYVYSIL